MSLKTYVIYTKMGDFTKPGTILAGVSTIGVISTSVYFSNKTNSLAKQIATIDADIDTIKDGLKEKVPMLENAIKTVDHGLRNMSTGMQNFANHTKKIEKKFSKSSSEVSEMSEALDVIDNRMVRLMEALVRKGVVSEEEINPPVKAPPIQRARASKETKRRSSDSDSEESESESESEPETRRRNNKNRSSRSVPPPSRRSSSRSDDADDIDQVVRMASGRRN